jgi:hypothetical protein
MIPSTHAQTRMPVRARRTSCRFQVEILEDRCCPTDPVLSVALTPALSGLSPDPLAPVVATPPSAPHAGQAPHSIAPAHNPAGASSVPPAASATVTRPTGGAGATPGTGASVIDPLTSLVLGITPPSSTGSTVHPAVSTSGRGGSQGSGGAGAVVTPSLGGAGGGVDTGSTSGNSSGGSDNASSDLAAPYNFTATPSQSGQPSVTLKWSYTDSRAQAFEIARGVGRDRPSLIAKVPYIAGQTDFNYVDQFVHAKVSYTYVVVAVNTSARSASVSATVLTNG